MVNMERMNMMEKLTKEELMEKLGLRDLSDEDMKIISGGQGPDGENCVETCMKILKKSESYCKYYCTLGELD